MSIPLFKDFDKNVQDLLKDDFDTKFSLKVKTAAPYRVNITSTTDFNSKGGKTSLDGKVSAKWAHESGFTLDKLELKNDGSLVTESSMTGLYPGVKLEFKGDDSFKGDLGVIYSCSAATVSAEVDLVEFSSVKASAFGRAGPVNLGAALELRTGDKAELKTIDVAASYAAHNAFVGLKTSNKFARYDSSVSYALNEKSTLAGLVSFTPEKSACNGTFGATYKCCSEYDLKVKANCDGILSASVKRTIGKGFSVVGSTQVDIHDPAAFRLGVVTTLG